MMFCWHRWKKWSDPSNGIFANLGDSVGHFSVCQYRTCEKCGLAQVRKLPAVRSIEELRAKPAP
jgi:hypothetical protein